MPPQKIKLGRYSSFALEDNRTGTVAAKNISQYQTNLSQNYHDLNGQVQQTFTITPGRKHLLTVMI